VEKDYLRFGYSVSELTPLLGKNADRFLDS